MTRSIWNRCLSDRPGEAETSAFHRWVEEYAPRIAHSGEAVLEFLAQVETEMDALPEDLLTLLATVLDAMRMNIENGERDAGRILEQVGNWMSEHASGLGAGQKMALCQAYVRAGLSPPDSIRIRPDQDLDPDELDLGLAEMPDIEALLSDLIPEDVSGYQAYAGMRAALGAMPDEAAALFMTHVVAQAVPGLVSLGRYGLLDPLVEIRVATAQGFAELAQAGAMDASVLSDLIRLRKWLPDAKSKSALDPAIRTALRREPSGGAVPRAWRLHRLMTTLPDGTGSQSIAASVSRGSEKSVAMVLLKADHGIKDAYAIPCSSASEQRRLLAEITEQVPMHDIPEAYLPDALALALRDGLDRGLPPAPGFIDVAQMLGLDEITAAPPRTPSEIADPEGEVTALSVQKRGRLINQSLAWAQDHEIADSWFVTDAALSDALDGVWTERQAEKVVWERLDQLRDVWAMVFARAASILRHAGVEDWQTFAAVVHGLESGRALKKIPIFEAIAAMTLDAAEQGEFDGPESDPFDDDPGEFDIAPEARGEFARLLRGSQLSPDHIDGFLTAIIVAPHFATPQDWLPPLLEGISLPDEGSLQRVLDIVMLRYGAIRDGLFDGDIAADLRKRPEAKFAQWLAGFSAATEVSAAWPKRGMSKDDKKILALIRDGSEDKQIQTTLKPLLPSWLASKATEEFND